MAKNGPQMRAFERRALTAGEIALGRAMFGDDIDWARVRITQLPAWGFFAMVPFGRTIVYANVRAWRDFSRAPIEDQGIFVHELCHVWQAARGMILAFAKLGALGRRAYQYEPRAGAALRDYNIESQAEIARHLFEWRLGAPDSEAPSRTWLEDIWARR